jgi:uncharacterized protein with LGFP repeats
MERMDLIKLDQTMEDQIDQDIPVKVNNSNSNNCNNNKEVEEILDKDSNNSNSNNYHNNKEEEILDQDWVKLVKVS